MAARHDISASSLSDGEASECPERRKLGLIAGHGRFPISLAQAARDSGYEVVAVAIASEASQDLAQHVDRIFWVDAGDLNRTVETFRSEGVQELVMAGKIQKGRIFDLGGVEKRLADAVAQLRSRGDDAVLRVIAGELERRGLKVRGSASFMASSIPGAGLLTSRAPTDREQADIDFGFRVARQLADLGIGQTVVVKSGVVVAVEALEGTDAAIARAGTCGGPGTVVCKVSGPNQDLRFDLPVVGPRTVEVLTTARCGVLAIEAGRTVVLERAEVVNQSNEAGLALVAM